MSKKKKSRGKAYTASQFVEIVCKQCKHCSKQGIKKVKPDFCYKIFKPEPWSFIKHTVPRIKKIEKCIFSFEDIFCNNCEICDSYLKTSKADACKNLPVCIEEFKIQTGQIMIKGNDLKISTFSEISKSVSKPAKKKEPYRVTAYPTMFHGKTDPSWAKFIKETVEETYSDDNNNSEQNNSA